MKKIFFLLFVLSFSLNAQNKATDSGGQVITVQPKIMVIPFVKEGEDIRTILEEDADRRIAITKIKEGFDNRGFTTVDFTAKLKSAKDNSIFTSDNQTDLKTQIIEMSGADIYIQSEIVTHRESSGNSIKIILTGYEVSTGNSLSNKVCESGKFYTDDFGRLASKAVETCIDDFLNVMQTKFTDIVNNGKSIIVDISFAESSHYNTSSEFKDELFSDLLETWMEENAFKNNYHIQGTTDLRMIFDDVKIPLKDQSNGRNYNPNKFASLLIKYLKNLGLEVGRDIKGNTIFITIK
jgi:hypothetical protein